MAKNRIYSDNEYDRRPSLVGNNVAPGTAFVRDESNTALVAVTGSGDFQWTETFGPVQGSGRTITVSRHGGGIGLRANEATTTTSGTWAFPVTGASAATVNGTPVYAVVGASVVNGTKVKAVTSLTLTKGTNVLFGYVEFFRGETSSTDTAVTIGA